MTNTTKRDFRDSTGAGASAQKSINRGRPLVPVPAKLSASLMVFWCLAVICSAIVYMTNEQAFWVFWGSLVCLIVTIPTTMRHFDLVSPWTIVAGGMYLACGLRGLYITLNINGTRSLDALYLRGNDIAFFQRAAWFYVTGIGLLTATYVMSARRSALRDRPPALVDRQFGSRERVRWVVIVVALLGFVGFFLFARSTGGLSLATLSAKRTTISGLQLGSYQSHGEFRVLAAFAPLALWTQIAYYAVRGVRYRLVSLRSGWLVVLFSNACLLPIYASSRADIVYVVIGALVVHFSLGPGRLAVTPILVGCAIVLLTVTLLTVLRTGGNDALSRENVDTAATVDAFVLTRTIADIPTTGNIVNAIPTRLEFANGKTVASWVFAPIPRAIWPDKPVVSAGPLIGVSVFGNDRSGVPPGFIAEGYWNFAIPGLIIFPIASGLVLRLISEHWRPWARWSPAAAILTASIGVQPGAFLIMNSFGSVFYQVALALTLALPVVLLSTKRQPGVPRDVAEATRYGRRSGYSGQDVSAEPQERRGFFG